MYYPVSHDGQVQAYNQLRKKYLAEEAERKKKQKLLRQEMGLPDVNDNRGIISRILDNKTKAIR